MAATLSSSAFDEIAEDERDDGFKAEVKGIPGSQTDQQTACIVAQMLTSGTASPGVPTSIVGDGSAAAVLFGRGSLAHRMVMEFRRGNPSTPIDVIGLNDNDVGVAASRTITLDGTALSSGVINFYVGLDRVQVGVAVGDTAATLATALIAAVTAATDLMVTAAAVEGQSEKVAFTCRHKGEVGNDIKLHVNMLGSLGGESLPDGITVSGTGFLTSGAANPSQAAARAAVQNREYYYYNFPWTDTASLDAWSEELAGMWSVEREQWGRVGITARRGSLSQLKVFGAARNDKLISCTGVYGTPGPAYETAARVAAKVSRSLANHPVRPLHTLVLTGERAPDPVDQFDGKDRSDLLWNGISTTKAGPGNTVVIGRQITLYQRNAANDRDDTWLDINTPATAGLVVNKIKKLIHDRFIATRCILVDDDTAELVDPAVPCCSPKKVQATVFAHYDELRRAGLVENEKAFRKLFKIGRDPNNATRLNMVYTPDLANPLVTFAAQISFSIQWPEDLVQAA